MKEATNCKKDKKNKKLIIAAIIVFLLSIIFSLVYIWTTYDIDKIAKENSKSTQQWNSDAKLIDDRLPENYPIMFITSPASTGDVVVTTTMCLYNNGDYITLYLGFDNIDEYTKESISSDAFIQKLIDEYEESKETSVANLLTDNIVPSDARDAYLKQYSIENFSMETSIDMTNTSSIAIEIYGCTYEEKDGEIIGTTHKYYSEQSGSTKTINDDNGYSVLEWFVGTQSSETTEKTEN